MIRRKHVRGVNNLKNNPNRKFRIEEEPCKRKIDKKNLSDGQKLLQELKRKRGQ